MALESGDFIQDADETNPPSADKKKQGDDHIRLIKKLMKGTFPNADKAFYFPTTEAKAADFAVLASHMNRTFLIDTTASRTATLPVLISGDAGWCCFFMKTTTDVNPYFIAPPSGTIQSGAYTGLTKTRRAIPGVPTKVTWTGAAFIAERTIQLPIGSVIDNWLATLPVGYEWADGVALSSALNYPDFNAAKGGLTTPDCRERTTFGRDPTAAVTRLTTAAGGLDGDILGAVGGLQSEVVGRTHLENFTLADSLDVGGSITPSSGVKSYPNNINNVPSGGGTSNAVSEGGAVAVNFPGTDLTVTGNVGGGGNAYKKVNPGIILNKILVVE